MKMLAKMAVSVIGIGVLMGSATAQDMRTASENVVVCQNVEDASARLDCFEQAAAELSVIMSASMPSPEMTAAQAPVTAGDAVQQATAPAATTATSTPAAVQQASTSATENIPSSSLPSWIPRISFGGGRDVEKEPDEFETKLTRIQANRIGRHFFTTADGHVWRQKKPEEIRAPKKLPADIILYQNITGGIRLKIVETNRSYAVQRVE